MKVILRQDIDELGFEGDIVNVANGYARNFLMPQGIALEASPENIKALASQRKKIETKRLKAKDDAEKLKQELEAFLIDFKLKSGEEGKLYGSVTSMDIASRLEKKGIVIDRRKILLDKPIKSLGEYDVAIKIYPGLIGSVKVVVAPEQEKGE
jgi:large subunit ribosomal protein L9